MKKTIIGSILFCLAAFLFGQNAVDYRKEWESRNILIYENGNELFDIYVNEYPVTKGTVYNVQYCIEKKEYSEKQSAFAGWFIHDEYNLYFDTYEKSYDFMDTLTKEYLNDKSILKTNRFLRFVEKEFNYQFEDKKYYDYESRDKRYWIKLISGDDFCASIKVFKTFYGRCEETEYSFVYTDYKKNIDYWIDDFDADIFFLQFATFYSEDFDDDKMQSLQDYFETLPGQFTEAEGMRGDFTVDEYDMDSLYFAFKHDLLYTTFQSFLDVINEDETEEKVSYTPVFLDSKIN